MTDIAPVVLPSLAGYSWRALGADLTADAPSLRALTAAADRADNNEILAVPVQQPHDLASADLTHIPAMSAITPDGEIAGVAWITSEESESEIVVSLHGRVHPEHRCRGIDSALLTWSEVVARERFADHHKPIRLFIRNETLADDARKLYAQHGFDLLFIERVMRRKLTEPLPDFPMPAGITIRAWTAELIPAFYSAYNATFAERPGFPGWSLEKWLDWIAGDDDFRPDYSWLAFEDGQPVAFLITTVDPIHKAGRAGWIAELGSQARVRRRGISAALLVNAMAAYRAEGLEHIALMVNDNNPTAQALYRKVGLDVLRYRGKYEKHL